MTNGEELHNTYWVGYLLNKLVWSLFLIGGDNMKKDIDTSMFWDAKRTLTHNTLINIIVGNRGGGKSFGAKQIGIDNFIDDKKIIIDNFIEHRQQFGYIRRYKDDLKEPMIQFFKDIEFKYPDYEFKTDSKYFYCRLKPSDPDEKWTEKDICGYGFTLSTASNKKSISYERLNVKTIN